VFLYRSTLRRSPGAAVAGVVESSRGPAYGQWLAAGFWLSMTVVVLAFGLLFATLGRAPLFAAADTLAHEPGPSAVTTLVAGCVAFVAAMVGFVTVIGIPLGIAILVFLLPALGFAGYLVAGTALGARLVERVWRTPVDAHPLAAVALGLLVLQAVGFIPLLGGVVVLAAGVLGAGALVYRAWLAWRANPAGALAAAPAH
jgi:MFS family permease